MFFSLRLIDIVHSHVNDKNVLKTFSTYLEQFVSVNNQAEDEERNFLCKISRSAFQTLENVEF